MANALDINIARKQESHDKAEGGTALKVNLAYDLTVLKARKKQQEDLAAIRNPPTDSP